MPDAVRVAPFTIVRLTNSEPDFYTMVGPFLSRREIVGELGSPVWDDDGKVWYVARADDQTIGVVGVLDQCTHSYVCSLYVIPEGRKQVVGAALLMAALRDCGPNVRAVVTEAARELFGMCGFRELGMRGRYFDMRKGTG